MEFDPVLRNLSNTAFYATLPLVYLPILREMPDSTARRLSV